MGERENDATGVNYPIYRLRRDSLRTGMAPPESRAQANEYGAVNRPVSRVDTAIHDINRLTASESEEKSARIRAGDHREETPGRQALSIYGWVLNQPPRIPKNDGLAKAFLAAAVIIFGVQFLGMKDQIEKSRVADQPPLSIRGPLVPERQLYFPGETVVFKYHRTVDNPGDVVLQIDAFENTETGEGYSASIQARTIEKEGDQELTAVRKLPDFMRPGRYRLEGFALSQTPVRSRPAVYVSLPFTVGERSKSK